jgi:hypothetical protein
VILTARFPPPRARNLCRKVPCCCIGVQVELALVCTAWNLTAGTVALEPALERTVNGPQDSNTLSPVEELVNRISILPVPESITVSVPLFMNPPACAALDPERP